MSLASLRDSLAAYQKALKVAKSEYLSSIISNNCSHPRVLFNTIDSVINPHPTILSDVSAATFEVFATFFNNKVSSVGQNMCNMVMQLDITCASPEPITVFDQFDSVSLSSLANIVRSMKPTNCPLDVIPARLLKWK